MDIKRDILPMKDTMYRLALRITLDSQEAEDVVQETIIKLWKMRDNLGNVENLEAYVLRMTRNLALDKQRLRANQNESIDVMPEQSHTDIVSNFTSADVQMEQQERIDSIRSTMNALPEKQRIAMQLRDFEGKSYKEIAEVMDISEDQVKVSIFRARQYIKMRLTSFN